MVWKNCASKANSPCPPIHSVKKEQDSELRGHLNSLKERGTKELRAVRVCRALKPAFPRALHLLWVVPLAFLTARWLTQADSLPGPFAVLLATLLVPALWLGVHAAAAAMRSVKASAPLAAIDSHLELEDRLGTASEFLADSERSSFQEAALEDGLDAARTAATGDWSLPRATWFSANQAWPYAAAASLFFILNFFVGAPLAPLPTGDGSGADSTLVAGLEHSPKSKDAQAPGKEDTTPLPAPEKEPTKKEDSAPAKEKEKAGKLSKQTKPSEGKTGSGKSSDAQSQTAASESRGAPSGQTPAPPKGKPKKPLESKPPKKKKAAEDKPRKPKNDEDQGGSTAGKGSAKGSNRNTTTSKWSSKDQVTTPDEQEIEEDEDTEDEEEEQENRGGMQPNLRDRRPPVSRDLRIGFGNQPNPDANGRGGPSEAKKSRGTASLVLGVPIPDRIKGQPNPGPTRITQERIEPSAEDPEPETARAQNVRGQAVGTVKKPAPPAGGSIDESGGNLSPWMSRLVRNYFTARRTPGVKKPSN
jgi:hypothetical protein